MFNTPNNDIKRYVGYIVNATLNIFMNKMFNIVNMKTISDSMMRLYYAASEIEGIKTQAELAALFGTSSQAIGNWEKRGISSQGSVEAERLLGCSASWLMYGTGEMLKKDKANNSEISIPVYHAYASMGNGEPMQKDTISTELKLNKTWANVHLHEASKLNNLAVITGRGDSMSPTYNDGDILIVDIGVKDCKVDGVYVLSANNRLYIKRVSTKLDGTVVISSDNPGSRTTYPILISTFNKILNKMFDI